MKSFIEEVAATPGGEKIYDCIQCGVCTGTCPTASEMEYPPRKTIAMIRAGMRDEVLSSGSMWHCVSCYLCTVRCPKGVKPTELAHALETLTTEQGFIAKETDTPAMYRSFVSSIKDNGRVHEFGIMLMFYLKADPILSINVAMKGLLAAMKGLPLALSLLRHGRLPLKPHPVKGKEELTQIMQKFAQVRGGQ